MSKKRHDRHKKGHQEPKFGFDEAKDLTVGQVIRKNEEVEAGVLPEDNILDKYIKQHREEIEADKFETRQFKKEELASTQSLEDMIQEVRESSETSGEVEESDVVIEKSIEEIDNEETTQFVSPLQDEESTEIEPLVLTETASKEMNEENEKQEETYTSLSRSVQTEPETGSKKRRVITIVSVVAAILVLAGTYYVYRQVSRSSQEIQSSQSSSGNQESQTDLQEFNTLYDSFYTDENKTALKNSQFDKLSQLKTLLDKLEGSRDHTLAKSKYDSLATQIKAIQDVNALFESPAITDGILDTNAKAKADAKFTEIKTGNTELDKLLDKAISLGKSQQTSASSSNSSSSQASSSSATESNASSTTPSTSTTAPARDTNGGLSSDGVNLQRSASRVPYNQTAVDDSNNPAWTFADGVLEQILATSRARGYITGNQYILERVNIVNGNGYYNLYKPDGTYLFTLNCKTGYFVGNGAGHADDLDY
ncbi:cell division site-positioning protein MapZ [Streptococcus oralis]|uniref:Mid-cell-anchored protein Z n=2 Tax=Streptococcus oralis TaxID=1303 RepID=A0A224A413_STROR|nr:cell division site-positioning protein MapZ family protein [Streptococcus oralis]MBA1351865.1 Holliday junction resolvase [Streptococcus oralis subsp. oralis]ORO72960.1 Holliday junction resolvase [Streptococcus oralis subsp. oralis]BBA07953.1 Mid-cell-anchored protein Z [Streptococcus oralis subsp. tigurinus]